MSPIKYQYIILNVVLQITYVFCQIKQTAFLSHINNQWDANDLDFSKTGNAEYTMPPQKWNITVKNQDRYDIKIALVGQTWGFHSSIPSTINLIINGSTPNHTLYTNGTVLFIFNVDSQYFTTSVHLDNSRNAFKVYPPNNQSLATADIHQMINVDPRPRAVRFTQNDAWSIAPTSTGSSFEDPAIWPMFITIINDPINNTLTYQWRDAQNPNIVKIVYNSVFSANSGFNIYIFGDRTGDSFIISSFNISYTFNETDINNDIPTNTPSTNPTNIPSVIATNLSTAIPTIIPSANPSNIPSNTPTNIPSTDPSNIPTILPSNTPTTIPSHTPIQIPTDTPSAVPSNIPTTMPILVSTATTNSITTTSEAPSKAPTYSGLYTSSITTGSISISTTNSTENLQHSTNPATTHKPTINMMTTTKESITTSSMQTTLRTSEHLNTTNISKLLQTTLKTLISNNTNSTKPTQPTTPKVILEVSTNVIMNSTQNEGDIPMEDNNDASMTMNAMLAYMIIGGMLLCGICCLITGIRIGITYYKRKLNKNDTDEQPPDIEKQLSSNCVDNPRVLSIDRDTNASNESHESLYMSDEELFEQNAIDTPETQTNSHPPFNIKFKSEPMEQKEHEHRNNKRKRAGTGEEDILEQQNSLSYIMDDMKTTTKGNDIMLKQKTISSIIDDYNTLGIEYNVTANNGYPDEGIEFGNV